MFINIVRLFLIITGILILLIGLFKLNKNDNKPLNKELNNLKYNL